MSDPQLTLKRFFFDEASDGRRAIEQSGAGQQLSKALDKVPASLRNKARQELDTKLGEALDVDLVQVLLGGWNKYRQLQQFRDRAKYPKDQICLLSLASHSMKSSHRITFEIVAGEVPLFRLDFDAIVALTLEGIVLKVRDARIREISNGRCRGKGTLQLKGTVIFEKESPYFDLPGRIDLGDGIEIPGS